MSDVTAPEYLVKQPLERRKFNMDFSNLLSVSDGEAISGTPTLTSTTLGGETSDLFLSDPTISDNKVYFFAASGTHSVRYRIEITTDTTEGQILMGDGILRVTDK